MKKVCGLKISQKAVLIPLPKKLNASDCGDYQTISLITHASKILLKVLNK